MKSGILTTLDLKVCHGPNWLRVQPTEGGLRTDARRALQYLVLYSTVQWRGVLPVLYIQVPGTTPCHDMECTWDASDEDAWQAHTIAPGKSMNPKHNQWSGRLPPVAGGAAAVIVHKRQTLARDRPDECYADPAITEGEVEFTFTVLVGRGTAMRVGVAAADGSNQSWAIKLTNGELASEPVPREMDEREPAQFLKVGNEGGGRPLITHSVTVRVNMAMRWVSFVVANGMPIEPRNNLPACGVRPWVQLYFKDDAIALSSWRANGYRHQWSPALPCSVAKTVQEVVDEGA